MLAVARRWNLAGDELVAGRHYPRNWDEFEAWFSTETACRQYLSEMRWWYGFVCPTCTSTTGRRHRRGWWCPQCRRWASLTAGTVFGGTHVPLRTWLVAVWMMTNEKGGVSARSLERATGVNYRTAWNMLHKVRATFSQHSREPLSGLVEVDETFVGGQDLGSNRRGRSHQRKAVVIIASECVRGGKMRRIRVGRLADSTATSIEPWVVANIKKGSAIHTDGHNGYAGLTGLGYRHKVTVMKTSPHPAHVVFPRVHTVASLLKRWLLGTHQGGVQGHYIDAYLDEFVFRFNRRNSSNRGLLFYRVIEGCLEPDSYIPRDGIHRAKPVSLPKAATPALQDKLMLAHDDELFDWFDETDDGPPDPFSPLPTNPVRPKANPLAPMA